MEVKSNESLWVEKYRPSKIDDCILTPELKETFKGFVSTGKMPNIILAGGPGTGKTTVAKALCNELGYDYILINTSNERGIDVLRTNITQFASSASMTGGLKVVICDEFDHATPLLQAAMRATIEEFSKTARFIFTCNYPNRIIAPLHSRCSVISYNIRSEDVQGLTLGFFKRMCGMLTTEGIEFDKASVASLVSNYFPDFRRVINELQRYSTQKGVIDAGVVANAGGVEINVFIEFLKGKDFKSARKWISDNSVDKDPNLVFRAMYDGMYEFVKPTSIPELVLLIASYQQRGMNSPDAEVNLAAFAVDIMSAIEFV